jgi:hypothetical protein
MVLVGVMGIVCSCIASHRYCPWTLVVIARALTFLCMIFSENRFPLFGIIHQRQLASPTAATAVGRTLSSVAYFFFACSTQAVYSRSLTTWTAIGMKA